MSESESEFTKQLNLFERLVRMETKLDMALARQTDHEGRVRILEENLQNAKGGWKVLTAIGTASGVVGGILGKYIFKL